MIRFKYDNIEAKKLILEFKCKKCLSLTKTELLSVPELDFDTFKNVSCSYKHKCQCNACYSIEIVNGLYDNYGVIHGIIGCENDVIVHEVPDYPYNKETILVDTIHSYSIIESIVDGIDEMRNENKSYVYCLLFSNLISILDSFIKTYTEPIIQCDVVLVERFCCAFGIKKETLEEKKQAIKEFYNRKSFQYIPSQKKLLERVFNINIDFDDRINQYVAVRDVIIHRNAIDTAGYMHRIKKSQLLEALNVIKKHIRCVYNALFEYETTKIAERIINK